MTGYDHAARARELLDAATDLTGSIEASLAEPLVEGDPRDQLAQIESRHASAETRFGLLSRLHEAAQVHATLQLAEQQRIANLIALRESGILSTVGGSDPLLDFEEDPSTFGGHWFIREDVREGLGIRG